jgi:hypothetical protein
MLLAASYFVIGRRKLLGVVILSNLTMGIGFLLLGGYVGVGMCLAAVARDIVSDIIYRRRPEHEKNKIMRADWWWLLLWVSVWTATAAATQTGFVSLFAYFASLTFTISIWQKSAFMYRFLGILVGIFWIVYNLYLQSLMGFVLESILLVFVTAGFIAYARRGEN